MFSAEFLRHLRCPVTGSHLRCLDRDQLYRVNELIARERVVNQVGDCIQRPLGAGLINADSSLLYPVWDDIPALIPEEALAMSQFIEE